MIFSLLLVAVKRKKKERKICIKEKGHRMIEIDVDYGLDGFGSRKSSRA